MTPAQISSAGRRRLVEHIAKAGRLPQRHVEALADAALARLAPRPSPSPVSGSPPSWYGNSRSRRSEPGSGSRRSSTQLEEALARHPDAALIRSLPGMGVTLTAEFIAEAASTERFPSADRLAAAAGLAPVLKQSGKVRDLKHASGGNETLKRVLFQSAFCSLSHPASKAF